MSIIRTVTGGLINNEQEHFRSGRGCVGQNDNLYFESLVKKAERSCERYQVPWLMLEIYSLMYEGVV